MKFSTLALIASVGSVSAFSGSSYVEFCVVFEILMSNRQSLVYYYTVDLTMHFTFCLFPIFLVDNIVNMNCNFIIVHCTNHFCVCRSLHTVSREHP